VLAFSVVGAAAVLIPLATWRSRRRYLWGYRSALELGFCPGCGYDLSGISHLDVRGAMLRDVGTPRCSECGAPWPLVPPPVSGAART